MQKTMQKTIPHKPGQKPLRHKEPYAPKLTKSVILVCSDCSNRYIKTRKDQNFCLKCFVKASDLKKLKIRV